MNEEQVEKSQKATPVAVSRKRALTTIEIPANASRWQQRLRKAQRFMSDCSMGQHYHVFFHKRRYSYGSPVCGLISLIVYALLLFYMGFKFYQVFSKANYVNVEMYKPIDFEDHTISIYEFLKSIDLEIGISNNQNDCIDFLQSNLTKISTQNPSLELELTV
jgi:hypothetical protein